MTAALTDPWFEARFVSKTSKTGYHIHGDQLDGADGLLFWCPCGFGKPEYPLEGGRPHACLVSFANPLNSLQVTEDAGSHDRSRNPSRWTVSGTGLADLTLSPSIDNGTPSCWHGWIQGGSVNG